MFCNRLALQLCLFCLYSTVILSSAIPKKNKRNQVLMISFDGMQSGKFEEFLKNNPNSNFSKIIANGVKAEYMIPSFPSLTFPNHFTLVTGLYIENHGIVGNTVYDPMEDQRVNFLADPTAIANDAKWWNQGEPIWLTARNQGLKTGAFFWTGSEVITRTPDVWMTYNGNYPTKLKMDNVVNWISKLKIDLTFLYFDEPDDEGHRFGADAEEYMNKIEEVDGYIGYLTSKLKELNIYDDLNIVIVSGNGMTTMKNTILIQDFVDRTLINSTRSVFGVTSNIHPLKGYEQEVYNDLKKIPNVRVFFKHEVPEDLHYTNNERIAPIVVLCDDGYTLNTASVQTLKGNHGFDNKFESMRTIFLATGPNFKKNMKLAPFQNVNVYPLICELTQVNCNPHNGSLSIFNDVLQFAEETTTTSTTSTTSTSSSTTSSYSVTIYSSSTSERPIGFVFITMIVLVSFFHSFKP